MIGFCKIRYVVCTAVCLTSSIGQFKLRVTVKVNILWSMRALLKMVYFVVLSLFMVCAVEAAKKWVDEEVGMAPPYRLLAVRAEKYILPVLPYDVGDLEPYIDEDTVLAHYEGHHQAYRRKMNVVLNDWREDVRLGQVIHFVLSACTSILWLQGKFCYN